MARRPREGARGARWAGPWLLVVAACACACAGAGQGAATRPEPPGASAEELRELVLRLEFAHGEVLDAPTWLAAAPAWCEATRLEGALRAAGVEPWGASHQAWTDAARERRRRARGRMRRAQAGDFPVTVVRGAGTGEAASRIVRTLRMEGWSAETSEGGGCAAGLVIEPSVLRACEPELLRGCRVFLRIEARRCGAADPMFEVSREADASGPALAAAADEVAARTLAALGARCEASAPPVAAAARK